MSMNILNDISQVYLDQVAFNEAKVDEKLPEHERATARDKRSGNNLPGSGTRRARRSEHEARRGKPKRWWDDDGDGKGWEKGEVRKESLDPVGQEDSDPDNDGNHNDPNDKYIMKRRKAIGKAIAKKSVKESSHYDPMDDDDFDHDEAEENRGVSGKNNPKGGKALGKKKKNVKEGFSNWRQDLSEVMDDIEANKQVKEKKVDNKIKINPEMKEAVEQLGGELVEMVELDEKMNMKKAEMGDVIKDFYKSDAPQFKGKSKEKRREMAIAAKLTAERGGKKLGEDLVTEKDEKIEAKFKGARTPFLLDKFRKEHPGSRQPKRDPGAKETESEKQRRLTNRQVERAVKYGLTKKEKGETQGRERYYSSRD